jgi:DNA-binding beta-propeller fold protein YncE
MQRPSPVSGLLIVAAGACAPACSSSSQGAAASPSDAGIDAGGDAGWAISPVALPGGAPGIGFDDLRYAPVLGQILAPGGRTGNLDLVDPGTLAVTAIGGFSASATFVAGAHSSGCTSADEGVGVIFAIDHETQSLRVVDSSTKAIVSSTVLAGAPDYVRWIASTSEAWVTEPGTGLEVLTVPASGPPVHAATIAVSGGPEAIVVDAIRGRVYTNSFTGQTFAIDIAHRTVVETWSNGCGGVSLGLAVDPSPGFVFVACQAGSVVVLDAAHGGTTLGKVAQGSGLDILDYSPSLHHLYAPSKNGTLGIVAVSAAGVPTVLGAAPVPKAVQGVATNGHGAVWIGDPTMGRILRIEDRFPASP